MYEYQTRRLKTDETHPINLGMMTLKPISSPTKKPGMPYEGINTERTLSQKKHTHTHMNGTPALRYWGILCLVPLWGGNVGDRSMYWHVHPSGP